MIGFCFTSITTDRRQFTLFYLFYFSFFCILFASLRFGLHFWSHDSHVTGEHMVELGGHFFLFSARANSSSTYTYTYMDTELKVTSLVQVQEAVFRE